MMSEISYSVMKNANEPKGPSSKIYSPILKPNSPSGESKKNSNFNKDDSKKNYTKPQNSINPYDEEFIERRNLLSSLLITEFTKMDLQYSDRKVKKYSPKGIKKSNFGKKKTCGKHSKPLCTFNRTGQCKKGKECKFDHVMCTHEDVRLGKQCPRYKSCFFGHKVNKI